MRAEGSEAEADGDYEDEDEDEDEEGPLEERGPGRVRFSNVDRLVLIPALCDMDAATHKRLYWCTEDYEAIRRSALAEMKVRRRVIRSHGPCLTLCFIIPLD